MSFKDLSAKTPAPVIDKARTAPVTGTPGDTPAVGAPAPEKS